MASNSGFDKTIPSGISKVSDGDDDIRSFKSFVQAWLEEEHYITDGSADSAGISKHGAGRAFVGTASQLSNPTADNDGRLFFVTDDNVLRVGNLSTSSWSVVADNLTLASDNSWTGSNSFTPPNLSVLGVFSGVTSVNTVLGAAIGTAADSSQNLIVTNSPPVSEGDFLVASADSIDPNGASGYLLHAFLDSLGTLRITVNNPSASRLTFPSSTTLSVMGFIR